MEQVLSLENSLEQCVLVLQGETFSLVLCNTQGLLQKASERVSLNNKTIRFKTLTKRS